MDESGGNEIRRNFFISGVIKGDRIVFGKIMRRIGFYKDRNRLGVDENDQKRHHGHNLHLISHLRNAVSDRLWISQLPIKRLECNQLSYSVQTFN